MVSSKFVIVQLLVSQIIFSVSQLAYEMGFNFQLLSNVLLEKEKRKTCHN